MRTQQAVAAGSLHNSACRLYTIVCNIKITLYDQFTSDTYPVGPCTLCRSSTYLATKTFWAYAYVAVERAKPNALWYASVASAWTT